MTAAMAYMAPTIPRYWGRFVGGAAKPTMLNRLTVTPEPPTPWIARPTINVVGFFATAQMMLPISKIRILIKYHSLMGKYLNSFPQVDWKPPKVMKYAAPYHDTLFKSWNSSVILGIAVLRMV